MIPLLASYLPSLSSLNVSAESGEGKTILLPAPVSCSLIILFHSLSCPVASGLLLSGVIG